jgi:hypothetical protein
MKIYIDQPISACNNLLKRAQDLVEDARTQVSNAGKVTYYYLSIGPDDAANVSLGPIHLRGLFRRYSLDRPDEFTLGAPTHPSPGPRPNLPGLDLLQQGLREVR